MISAAPTSMPSQMSHGMLACARMHTNMSHAATRRTLSRVRTLTCSTHRRVVGMTRRRQHGLDGTMTRRKTSDRKQRASESVALAPARCRHCPDQSIWDPTTMLPLVRSRRTPSQAHACCDQRCLDACAMASTAISYEVCDTRQDVTLVRTWAHAHGM